MHRHVFYLFLHLWFLSIQRFIIFVLNVKLRVLVNFATEGGQKTSVHKLHVCPFALRLVACEQALLFLQVKRVSRERASEWRSHEGAEERRACNHPLQIFICTSPRRREIPLAEK